MNNLNFKELDELVILMEFIKQSEKINVKNKNNKLYTFKKLEGSKITFTNNQNDQDIITVDYNELLKKYNDDKLKLFRQNSEPILSDTSVLDTSIYTKHPNQSDTSDINDLMVGGNLFSETSTLVSDIPYINLNKKLFNSYYNKKYNCTSSVNNDLLTETKLSETSIDNNMNINLNDSMIGGLFSETSSLASSTSHINKQIFNTNKNNKLSGGTDTNLQLIRNKLLEMETTTYDPSIQNNFQNKQKGGNSFYLNQKNKVLNANIGINSSSTSNFCE